MIPEYSTDTFLVFDNVHGDGEAIPADVFGHDALLDHLQIDEASIRIIRKKVWARLQAPGFTDSTDWSGPYDTKREAKEDIIAIYEVHPESGESLDTCPECESTSVENRTVAVDGVDGYEAMVCDACGHANVYLEPKPPEEESSAHRTPVEGRSHDPEL